MPLQRLTSHIMKVATTFIAFWSLRSFERHWPTQETQNVKLTVQCSCLFPVSFLPRWVDIELFGHREPLFRSPINASRPDDISCRCPSSSESIPLVLPIHFSRLPRLSRPLSRSIKFAVKPSSERSESPRCVVMRRIHRNSLAH
jgi:hypothetical protein